MPLKCRTFFYTMSFLLIPASAHAASGDCPASKPANPPGFPAWLGVSFAIAPEFTQNRPFHNVDFEDSDKTNASLTATVRHCVSNRIGIKISGGPGITLDADGDSKSGSKLPVAAELRWFPGVGPIVPVLSVGTSAYFEDVFEKHLGDDQFIETGLSLGDQGWDVWSISDRRKVNLSGRAVWRWVDADAAVKGDYRGPSIDLNVQVPLLPKKIAINIKGTYADGRYSDRDQLALKRRHDRSHSAFAGFDFSGLIKPFIPHMKEASFGITYSKTKSNIDGADAKLKLQPALRVGMPF